MDEKNLVVRFYFHNVILLTSNNLQRSERDTRRMYRSRI